MTVTVTMVLPRVLPCFGGPLRDRGQQRACLCSRRPRWQLSAASKDARPFLQSDKCVHHAYHYAYSRYLVPLADRFVRGDLRHASVLEIGLGCGQNNVGAGVRMWPRARRASATSAPPVRCSGVAIDQ